MSLMDLLNSKSTQSSSTRLDTTYLVQQALAKQAAKVETGTIGTASGSQVRITLSARRAAADANDQSKTAAKLGDELRKAFGKKDVSGKVPEMSALSRRAVAIVALNGDNRFSKAEVAAAKAQLRQRDRDDAVAMLNQSELTAASLSSYSQKRAATQSLMSAEERSLRAANPKLR